MRAVDPRVSFAELQRWPDDGRRYELYDGEVIVVPAPVPRHQLVLLNLTEVLREYGRATQGVLLVAPVDVVFSEHVVLQPDLAFFRREGRDRMDVDRPVTVRPDLVVEVLSRSTEARDRGRKMETYARFDVPEYWIVDPASNTLEIYRLETDRYQLVSACSERAATVSPTLAGLTIDCSRVFAE